MKLRNKKTGEIETGFIGGDSRSFHVEVIKGDKLVVYDYKSLAELNEEWEDAPGESKGIEEVYVAEDDDACVVIKFGNSKEAKIAEQKLKAWQRLKDKGFKFRRFREGVMGHEVNIYAYFANLRKDEIDDAFYKNKADLNICFGGEDVHSN